MPTATPLHPLFAARVAGIDIGRRPGPEDAGRVRDALGRRPVLVFSQPSLTDEQQVAFARAFGPPETTRAGADRASPSASATQPRHTVRAAASCPSATY